MSKPGLAILQNMWVRDPARMQARWAKYEARTPGLGEEMRRRMIVYALFRGCLTGRRLEKAFGDLTEQCVWEESTREIADNPKTVFKPDEAHIEKIILEFKPKVVLAFGQIASAASFRVLQKMTFGNPEFRGTLLITAPHPAARQAETPRLLAAAAENFRKAIQ